MKPWEKLFWHFGGLLAVIFGTVMLAGWPAIFIVVGVWSIAATMVDTALERRGQ